MNMKKNLTNKYSLVGASKQRIQAYSKYLPKKDSIASNIRFLNC